VQQSDGSIASKAGAILGGTVNIDISDTQRQQLIAQIKKDFNIDSPKLLPLRLSDAQIQTTVLDKITGFGDNVQQVFPAGFQIGSDFAFSVGSLNSGFAQLVGNLTQAPNATTIVSNPQFGMNITAQAEFVGDPWSADIDCDLSQVWSQVRSSAGATASFGWFRLGSATYNSVAQNLQKSGACTFVNTEGSLDTAKYGRQVLEMTKQMFEAINAAASTGQNYFQFQPNPEAPPAGGGGGGFNLFGWGVSINASYSSASFTQGIRWHTHVSYTGHAKYPVALGTALAVSCSGATQQYFVDLADASQPCITQPKIDVLQTRLAAEAKAKLPLYTDLNSRLASGLVTLANYTQLKSAIDQLVITDTTYSLANISLPGLGGAIMKTGGRTLFLLNNKYSGSIRTQGCRSHPRWIRASSRWIFLLIQSTL
jgi:hypothetical protein